MKKLIEKGANVNKKNSNRKTPICFVNSKEAYNLLISSGAKFEKIDVDYRNKNIYPTRFLFKYPEILDLIIETVPDSLFKHYEFYELMLNNYIHNIDTFRIKKLLQKGASLVKPILLDAQFPTLENNQPLHFAGGSKEMFKFLINNGAQLKNIDYDGNDAYFVAFNWKDTLLFEWLEQKGLPMQKPNNPYFARQSDTTFMIYLMKKGVSINSVDRFGNTALIRAKHWDGNRELEKFLLNHGADKTIVNNKGGSYFIGQTRVD
jgi:ankyrin repeat protein